MAMITRLFLTAAAHFTTLPAYATNVAHTPSISGNIWAAVAIIAVLVAVIVLLVWGSFGLEKRDAKLGRRNNDGGGGFGIF